MLLSTTSCSTKPRFSRLNNIRLVGIHEPATNRDEDCVALVEGIINDKFGISVKVERAHRDGKPSESHPRHILFKLLSYRDKVSIMKIQRTKLASENFSMVDDLIPDDLKEKRKRPCDVQCLYDEGVRLRFYARKWRAAGGALYTFTETQNASA